MSRAIFYTIWLSLVVGFAFSMRAAQQNPAWCIGVALYTCAMICLVADKLGGPRA